MMRDTTPLLPIAARGFCMGAADVVPGVSGGTMAFVLGIYERLLRALRSFDLELVSLLLRQRDLAAAWRHVDATFLAALGAGVVAAVIVFTRVIPIPALLVTHPEPIYGLFFGLIAASIVVLLRSVPDPRAAEAGWVALGAALGFGVVNLVPVNTPDDAWFIFLAGAVAISAMLLPGISGSFILLILRKYAYVFDALGRLDFTVIVPFALGIAAGLMAFSRAVSWLLGRFPRQTLFTITGVLVGSLWIIWPFQQRVYETVRGKARLMSSEPVWPANLAEPGVIGVIGWFAIGVAAVLAVQWLAGRRRATADA